MRKRILANLGKVKRSSQRKKKKVGSQTKKIKGGNQMWRNLPFLRKKIKRGFQWKLSFQMKKIKEDFEMQLRVISQFYFSFRLEKIKQSLQIDFELNPPLHIKILEIFIIVAIMNEFFK